MPRPFRRHLRTAVGPAERRLALRRDIRILTAKLARPELSAFDRADAEWELAVRKSRLRIAIADLCNEICIEFPDTLLAYREAA